MADEKLLGFKKSPSDDRRMVTIILGGWLDEWQTTDHTHLLCLLLCWWPLPLHAAHGCDEENHHKLRSSIKSSNQGWGLRVGPGLPPKACWHPARKLAATTKCGSGAMALLPACGWCALHQSATHWMLWPDWGHGWSQHWLGPGGFAGGCWLPTPAAGPCLQLWPWLQVPYAQLPREIKSSTAQVWSGQQPCFPPKEGLPTKSATHHDCCNFAMRATPDKIFVY